jgi:hypothetical protein
VPAVIDDHESQSIAHDSHRHDLTAGGSRPAIPQETFDQRSRPGRNPDVTGG